MSQLTRDRRTYVETLIRKSGYIKLRSVLYLSENGRQQLVRIMRYLFRFCNVSYDISKRQVDRYMLDMLF